MRINDKFKIKLSTTCTSLDDGEDYVTSLDRICYLYYDLTITLKDKSKYKFQSGDCGGELLTFISELKTLISNVDLISWSENVSFDLLDTGSIIDEATGDSSFLAIKWMIDDKTYYDITFKNPNGTAISMSNLEELEVVKIVKYFEKQLNKMIKAD